MSTADKIPWVGTRHCSIELGGGERVGAMVGVAFEMFSPEVEVRDFFQIPCFLASSLVPFLFGLSGEIVALQ